MFLFFNDRYFNTSVISQILAELVDLVVSSGREFIVLIRSLGHDLFRFIFLGLKSRIIPDERVNYKLLLKKVDENA